MAALWCTAAGDDSAGGGGGEEGQEAQKKKRKPLLTLTIDRCLHLLLHSSLTTEVEAVTVW